MAKKPIPKKNSESVFDIIAAEWKASAAGGEPTFTLRAQDRLAPSMTAPERFAPPSPPLTIARASMAELRYQNNAIDEVVAENCSVHLERMDDGLWCMVITEVDGAETRLWIEASHILPHVYVRHAETTGAE